MIIAILALVILCIYSLKTKKGRPPLASGALPLVGHAIKGIATSAEELYRLLKEYSMESVRRDEPLTIRVLATDFYCTSFTLVITNPANANALLSSCLQKDIIYDYLKPWIGEGLITASETIWQKHRKLLNPTFNQCVLDSYMTELNKQAKALVIKLSNEVEKGKFDHAPYMEHTTLQVIYSTAMGVTIDDKDVELRERYLIAKSLYVSGMVHRAQTFWLHSDYIYNHSNLKKVQSDLAKTLHALTNAIITKRKDELHGNKNSIEKRFKPFMEHLLDMEKDGTLSDTEIQEEVDSFTFAGSDTMSITLTATLLFVGSYPEVQKKIVEELREVFQESHRDVEKQDLLQLKYLEAVVKETLRLFPTVPLVGRKLKKDVTIGNYTFPSGSRCYVSLYGVNRHPSWGPDAEEFRPERWLEPNCLPSQHFASFGFGKRRCIGTTFALMTEKMMLAHVLRHYHVTGDVMELRCRMEVSARPVSKRYISIRPRNNTTLQVE